MHTITSPTSSHCNIIIDNELIEVVDHYIFLVQLIHVSGKQEKEILRITIAWSKFG